MAVPGFKPGAAYALERWDTYAASGRAAAVETLIADATGRVAITVAPLLTDTAFKLRVVPARTPEGRIGR
jgi:hypothetical protein